MSDVVGEKRPLEPAEDTEPSIEPAEKKAKIDDAVVEPITEEAPATDLATDPVPVAPDAATTGGLNFEAYPAFTTIPAQANPAFSDAANLFPNAEQGGIPFPPGYDPLTQNNLMATPLDRYQPLPPRRPRRKKAELLADEFPDPESKWSHNASQKLIDLYSDFGKRRVLDEKLHKEILFCLKHNGNPAVTLNNEEGDRFFTYLTVASECGDLKLVETFLTDYRAEFSEYDIAISLKGALQNREQEIAEYLLLNTQVKPDRDTVMEMFDCRMNDDIEAKVKPLRAFIETCLDTDRFPSEEFYIPEVLNRCIYAHNVAALRVLFELKKDNFLPLLEQATPEQKAIKAGRSKSNDIGEGVPPLAYAAVMERPGCLAVFLENGANPNYLCNEMGGTLLHIVGFKGNTELIELLISHNADPRIPNDRQVLPLTRTKGRKARKCVADAVARLNQIEGIEAPTTSEIPPSHPPPPNVQSATPSSPMEAVPNSNSLTGVIPLPSTASRISMNAGPLPNSMPPMQSMQSMPSPVSMPPMQSMHSMQGTMQPPMQSPMHSMPTSLSSSLSNPGSLPIHNPSMQAPLSYPPAFQPEPRENQPIILGEAPSNLREHPFPPMQNETVKMAAPPPFSNQAVYSTLPSINPPPPGPQQ